jgi:hypothetical protein
MIRINSPRFWGGERQIPVWACISQKDSQTLDAPEHSGPIRKVCVSQRAGAGLEVLISIVPFLRTSCCCSSPYKGYRRNKQATFLSLSAGSALLSRDVYTSRMRP